MKKFINPLTVSGLALVLGLVIGPAWYLLKANKVVATAQAARRLVLAKKALKEREKGWDFWTIEIDNLTSELQQEKERLRQQTDLLDQRAARLESEKQELTQLRTEIESMRKEMDDRVIAIGADEAKNLHSLAQTYSAITPEAAVAIIKEMDDSNAVKILSLMKPDVVGPIFEVMAKDAGGDASLARRAAELSDKLRLMKSAVAPSANAVSAN